MLRFAILVILPLVLTLGTSNAEEHQCPNLKFPFKPLGEPFSQMVCDTYRGWCDNMKLRHFRPTDRQASWWKALGSDQFQKYYKPSGSDRKQGGRRKRDADDSEAATRMRIERKEYRMLSDGEREKFHKAVRELKRRTIDGVRLYDIFTGYHQASMAPGAYYGPAFLPWHREYLVRFENALKSVDPDVSLPYWASTLDLGLGADAVNSITWSRNFLGNGIGPVVTGPFAGWSLAYESRGRDRLYRNVSSSDPRDPRSPRLMDDDAVRSFRDGRNFRDVTWYVNAAPEGYHDSAHAWVGGVMADIAYAPSDPAYFLHAAFVDCLWEGMRGGQRSRGVDPRYDYPNDTVALGVGEVQPDGRVLSRGEDSPHHATSALYPFSPLRVMDALSDTYTARYYTCAPVPACAQGALDCGSPYLFCDVRTYRCAPKLRLGAMCSAFSAAPSDSETNPCHASSCCSGVCTRHCPMGVGARAQGALPRPASPVIATTPDTPSYPDDTQSYPGDTAARDSNTRDEDRQDIQYKENARKADMDKGAGSVDQKEADDTENAQNEEPILSEQIPEVAVRGETSDWRQGQSEEEDQDQDREGEGQNTEGQSLIVESQGQNVERQGQDAEGQTNDEAAVVPGEPREYLETREPNPFIHPRRSRSSRGEGFRGEGSRGEGAVRGTVSRGEGRRVPPWARRPFRRFPFRAGFRRRYRPRDEETSEVTDKVTDKVRQDPPAPSPTKSAFDFPGPRLPFGPLPKDQVYPRKPEQEARNQGNAKEVAEERSYNVEPRPRGEGRRARGYGEGRQETDQLVTELSRSRSRQGEGREDEVKVREGLYRPIRPRLRSRPRYGYSQGQEVGKGPEVGRRAPVYPARPHERYEKLYGKEISEELKHFRDRNFDEQSLVRYVLFGDRVDFKYTEPTRPNRYPAREEGGNYPAGEEEESGPAEAREAPPREEGPEEPGRGTGEEGSQGLLEEQQGAPARVEGQREGAQRDGRQRVGQGHEVRAVEGQETVHQPPAYGEDHLERLARMEAGLVPQEHANTARGGAIPRGNGNRGGAYVQGKSATPKEAEPQMIDRNSQPVFTNYRREEPVQPASQQPEEYNVVANQEKEDNQPANENEEEKPEEAVPRQNRRRLIYRAPPHMRHYIQ